MLEGGSFEDGSILVSEEIKFNTEEGKAVLENFSLAASMLIAMAAAVVIQLII